MSTKHSKGRGQQQPRGSRRKWLGGVATAVLIGVLIAGVNGAGEAVVGAISTDDPRLLSYGVEEVEGECVTGTYLPDSEAAATIEHTPPYSIEEWDNFIHQPGAAHAGESLVQVSIQGESARKITLLGIEFDVERHKRQQGAAFAAACGDALRGRGVEVDLETDPPRIVSSNRTLEGIVTASPTENVDTAPISFPWTVSVTDPLLLYVLATARSCDCTWTATVPWVSGSEKGKIQIDGGGGGYRVVGSTGLPGYTSTGRDWRRY